MSNITLSSAVRANLTQLQNIARLTDVTQERLSTGRDVNSALDDPRNFFTSRSLSTRASDLSGLLDSMSTAINTVQAADRAIDNITKLVDAASATTEQALQEGASYEQKLTGTAITAETGTVGTDKEKVAASLITQLNGGTSLAVGDTVEVAHNDGTTNETYTFTVGADSTVQDLVDGINASGVANARVTDDGELEVTTDQDGTTAVTVDATTAANSTALGGFVDDTATNLVESAGTGIDADRAKALKAQFDELRTQIDSLVSDADYNGKNLLQDADLKVVFNEEVGAKQSSLNIEGVDFDATSLGVPTNAQVDFESSASLEDAFNSLKEVKKTLQNQQQQFGADLSIVQIRKDFTQSMVETLQKGADELVLADPNEQGANMLALQTRQQLASTSLGLANQADQAVLRLF